MQKLLSQFELRAMLAAGPTKRRGTKTFIIKSSVRQRRELRRAQPAAWRKMQTHARCTKRKKQRKEEKKSPYGVLLWRMKRWLEGAKLLLRYFTLSDMREKMSHTARRQS
jgi:hypothetical protein